MKHKILILGLLVVSYGKFAEAKNLGHRAGGGKSGYFKELPENSISALLASIGGYQQKAPIQFNKKFVYLEFDVRETLDRKLVVLHDESLTRMVDLEATDPVELNKLLNDGKLKEIHRKQELKLSDLRVKYLTLEQIKIFRLKGGEGTDTIPTLREFLYAASRAGLQKPVAVEVKSIETDEGREKLINLMMEFRDQYLSKVAVVREAKFDFPQDMNVMSFAKHFDYSFGKKGSFSRKYWCQRLRDAGFAGFFTSMDHSRDNCAE